MTPGHGDPHGARFDRRRFLIVMAGAAAYGALRPHAGWARKLAQTPAALQPWSLPSDPPGHPVELARALIGAAVLAPSNWNSQPWTMEVDGRAIRLVADPQRALPVTDPDRRQMMLSLGAALENLLVAARAYGLRTTVTYFPHGPDRDVVAEVSWVNGEPRRDRQLFAAITERRTNRRSFDGRGIILQNRASLGAQIPEELRVHWLDDRDDRRAVSDIAFEAVRAQVRDRRAEAERVAWMRFGDDEVRRRGDGVSIDALELGGPAKWLAGRYFDPDSWFLRYGAGSAAKQAREAIRSAGAVALLTGASAAAREPGARQQTHWVTAGQAYERFALKATQLGIAHQPINQPIEVSRYRADLLRTFGAAAEEPLMLVRLGHAKRPRPTPRRAVALVASFRNS